MQNIQRLLQLVSLVALTGSLGAQSSATTLLMDINRQAVPPRSANPEGYKHLSHMVWDNKKFPCTGPFVYFTATGLQGSELYKATLFPGSTMLVKDINPNGSSSPDYLTLFNNNLIFAANDGSNGTELWINNTTTTNTTLVKDCLPGPGSSNPTQPLIMGNKFYFTADNGKNYDLWMSDGTGAGTTIVKSGLADQWNQPILLANKYIIFRGPASTTTGRYNPWVTDGTATGTHELYVCNPTKQQSGFINPIVLGNTVYFAGYNGTSYEIFKTDGTKANTTQVTTASVFGNYYWKDVIALGNKLLFQGRTANDGYEPWVTDGTATGTKMLRNIASGTRSGYFVNPILFNNRIYFEAQSSTSANREIWNSDGTTLGTVLVSGKSRVFRNPAVYKGVIYFEGRGSTTATDKGSELWITDGTNLGTREFMDINPTMTGTTPNNSSPSFLTSTISNILYFAADNGTAGREIWRSDGTVAGTIMIKDMIKHLPGTTLDSNPRGFIDLFGTTYFQANNGVNGTEIWKTDGTTAGTTLVKDVYTGTHTGVDLLFSRMDHWRRYGGNHQPVALGKTLFFRGWTAATGLEIWKTDGTAAGTKLVKDTLPGANSGYNYNPCVLGDQVYYFARTANNWSSFGLWKTNGNTVTRVISRSFDDIWHYPTVLGDKIIFQARQNSSHFSKEPWVTDGTAAGTMLLKDCCPGPNGYGFGHPVKLGGKIYFSAYDGAAQALWVTDGTPAGTTKVTNKGFPSLSQSFWDCPIVMGNRIFFQGEDTTNGHEIWVTDGTTAGTKMLKNIGPGNRSGDFQFPCVVGNVICFFADDGTNGNELWKTDGTTAGTVLLMDTNPGKAGSWPEWMKMVGSRHCFFAANNGTNGQELWVTDGTKAGTGMVSDIYPGKIGSPLEEPGVLANGKFLFGAKDPVKGVELFMMDPGANNQPIGRSNGAQASLTSTDPALGTILQMTITNAPSGIGAVIILGLKASNPLFLANSAIYWDIQRGLALSYMVNMQGGTGTLALPVPNIPALSGMQLTCQGFIGPTTTAPFSVDFTNGVLLTFGK